MNNAQRNYTAVVRHLLGAYATRSIAYKDLCNGMAKARVRLSVEQARQSA